MNTATVTFTTTIAKAYNAAWDYYMNAEMGRATEIARELLGNVQDQVSRATVGRRQVISPKTNNASIRLTLTPAEARVLGLLS